MKETFERFVQEEDAALAQWITIILFMLIAIGGYIIVWNNWGKETIVASTSAVSDEMSGIIQSAKDAQPTIPTF